MRLLDYRSDLHSQKGQDGILYHLFGMLGVEKGYCVEFGAWDGVWLSNTRRLLELGWSGMQMESDMQKSAELAALYEDRDDVITLNTMVSHEGDNSLDALFEKYDVPLNIDLLSIDVDGQDYHIWEALTVRKPKVVCIETNVSIPMYIDYATPVGVNATPVGASPLAMFRLGHHKGYKAVCFTDQDWIFVRDDLYDLVPIGDTSYAELYLDGTYHKNDIGMPSPLGNDVTARTAFEQCLSAVFPQEYRFRCLTGGAELSSLWRSQ